MPFSRPAVATDICDNAIDPDKTCGDKSAGNKGFHKIRIEAQVRSCLRPQGDCSELSLAA